MIKVVDIIAIEANLRRKELGSPGNVFDTAVAVHPAEIGEGKRLRFLVGIGLLRQRIFLRASGRNRSCGSLVGNGVVTRAVRSRLGIARPELLLQLIDLLLRRLQLLGDGGRNLLIGGSADRQVSRSRTP